MQEAGAFVRRIFPGEARRSTWLGNLQAINSMAGQPGSLPDLLMIHPHTLEMTTVWKPCNTNPIDSDSKWYTNDSSAAAGNKTQ